MAAGEHVCDKGEVGDRFYVIAAGDYDVFDGAAQINSMSRGDAFGEIALLQDCARTATVIARGDGTPYALERDDFLAAVTGHPQARTEAAAVAAARLANT